MNAKLFLIPSIALLAGGVRADQVRLNAALAHPVIGADAKCLTYLKVGLTGFRLVQEGERPPVNVAIVIAVAATAKLRFAHRVFFCIQTTVCTPPNSKATTHILVQARSIQFIARDVPGLAGRPV